MSNVDFSAARSLIDKMSKNIELEKMLGKHAICKKTCRNKLTKFKLLNWKKNFSCIARLSARYIMIRRDVVWKGFRFDRRVQREKKNLKLSVATKLNAIYVVQRAGLCKTKNKRRNYFRRKT